MNLRRIFILLGKETRFSSKNLIFVMAVVFPIVLTLLISLLFGTLFSGKPKLGINDQGKSNLAVKLYATKGLISKEYSSDVELRQAVGSGAVDLGLVIPEQFDVNINNGGQAQLSAYVWGESLQKNRALIATSLVALLREFMGQEIPVQVITASVGDGESVPWEDRLFPFVVFIAVILGGTMVPATSLVDEKQKKTLKAIIITPTTLTDVFISKGVFGFLISMLVAILVLFMNRAFGTQPYLLIGVLALSALLAATFGLLLGVLFKDINTLFAILKAIGILLYAPAFIYIFPGIPPWIGKMFPTYYMIGPIMDISQKDATWSQISGDIYILIAMIIGLIALVAIIARRDSAKEV